MNSLPAPPSNFVLEMRGISKSFSGVDVLRQVDFDVRPGEVHVLIGENGAGKSTLMKILAGAYTADAGETRWRGHPVRFHTPHEARQAGIAIIHEAESLIPHLSVAENLFLGEEPAKVLGLPFIHWNQMRAQAAQLLAQLNLVIDPATPVEALDAADQQMVEIAKVLRQSMDLIILDEPTASLSPAEVDTLFQTIRALTARGVAIIYISHRLEEVRQIGQRATILRDGKKVACVPLPETSADELIRLMVGENLNGRFPARQASLGREVLRVQGLTRYGSLDNISFNIHAGEIVGLTGLKGSGCTSLVRAIFGLEPIDEGTLYLDGEPVTIDSPQTAVALGLGILTEDREQQGVVPEMSTAENITLAALARHWPGPLLHHAGEQDLAEDYIRRLNIRPPSPDHPTRFLSGGMQQKVILSRWLASNSRVLIFDQPTRGIDIRSKVEIYRFMAKLADQGIAILIVSLELPELLGMCDRILITRAGALVASLPRAEATAERVMAYAARG